MRRFLVGLFTAALALTARVAVAQTDSAKATSKNAATGATTVFDTVKVSFGVSTNDSAIATNCTTVYATGGQSAVCDTFRIPVRNVPVIPPVPVLGPSPLNVAVVGANIVITGTWTEADDGFGAIDSFTTSAKDTSNVLNIPAEDTVGTAFAMSWTFAKPSVSDTGSACVKALRIGAAASAANCKLWFYFAPSVIPVPQVPALQPITVSIDTTVIDLDGIWTEPSDGFGAVDSFVTVARDNSGTLVQNKDTVGTAFAARWRLTTPSAIDTGTVCVQAKRNGLALSGSSCQAWIFTPPVQPPPPPPPPPPPGTTYPNLPAGYFPVAEIQFNGNTGSTALPPAYRTVGVTFGILLGNWAAIGWSKAPTITADSLLPQSPPATFTYTWPAGLSLGSSPGTFSGWADSLGTIQYSKIYESEYYKLVPGTASGFESPGQGMKAFGSWAVGNLSAAGDSKDQVYAMISGGRASNFTLTIVEQGQTVRSMPQNADTTRYLATNAWHQVEYLFTVNSLGVANGTLDVYIDGHHTHQYTNVVWRTIAAPSGFYFRKFDCTWGIGGLGQQVKRQTDKLLIGHIYISGIP